MGQPNRAPFARLSNRVYQQAALIGLGAFSIFYHSVTGIDVWRAILPTADRRWRRRFLFDGGHAGQRRLGVFVRQGFIDTVRRFDDFMRRSVAKHFAPIFRVEQTPAAADNIAFMLQEEGMGKKGEIIISNYHVGKYRDCDLQFFNVCYKRVTYHRQGGRRTRRNYNLVIDIGVPVAFEGKVYIKRDYGFLVNWLRGQFILQRASRSSMRALKKSLRFMQMMSSRRSGLLPAVSATI